MNEEEGVNEEEEVGCNVIPCEDSKKLTSRPPRTIQVTGGKNQKRLEFSMDVGELAL